MAIICNILSFQYIEYFLVEVITASWFSFGLFHTGPVVEVDEVDDGLIEDEEAEIDKSEQISVIV